MERWRGLCSCLLLGVLLSLGGMSAARADAAPGAWTSVTSLPVANYGAVATTGTDGRIDVIGGCTDATCRNPTSAVEAYDPQKNTWTALPPLAIPRWGMAATTGLDGRLYVLGGCGRAGICTSSQMLTSVEAYSPATNRWSSVAPLPVGRLGLAAATDRAGRVYAIGGCCSQSSDTSLVERYDPTANAWTALAPLPTGRYGLQAVRADDGRIYAIGGEPLISSLDQPLYATVEAYDPATGRWSEAAALPTPLASFGAAAGGDGRLYVIGGSGTLLGPAVATVLAYSPSADRWSAVASLPQPRAFLAAADATGRLYAIGGVTRPFAPVQGDVLAYTPPCRYLLGFAQLHAMAADAVGECTDDQSSGANGDALQHSTKGVLVWRKADNWTAFTDGFHTWIDGPDGLQERLNSRRFPWEANPTGLPVVP